MYTSTFLQVNTLCCDTRQLHTAQYMSWTFYISKHYKSTCVCRSIGSLRARVLLCCVHRAVGDGAGSSAPFGRIAQAGRSTAEPPGVMQSGLLGVITLFKGVCGEIAAARIAQGLPGKTIYVALPARPFAVLSVT